MKSGLVGFSGFVGGILRGQRNFNALFRSTNVQEMDGQAFDEVICAGAPAQKWKANKDPEADLQAIQRLMRHLDSITCDRFILISTVDVFAQPIDVNEGTQPTQHAEAYGKHRLLLEEFVASRFANHCIVRLPGLVGPGLRKNILFDFQHENNVAAIDSRAQFQFYPMVNLWADIQTTLRHGLKLVHLTAEPVSVGEIAAEGFGFKFENHVSQNPAQYRFQTQHAAMFGGTGAYQYSKRETLIAVRAYAQTEPKAAK
jgi:hypothetical protein